MSEDFFNDLLTKKDIKVNKFNLLDKLYEKPKKDKHDDVPHFPHVTKGYWQQSDLLFLPNDKGYMYCLVVVDVGNRLCDAVALKSKACVEVLKAFHTIYERKILGIPKQMTCDDGSEFHGQTSAGLLKMGIHINYGKVGRHRQTALVERKNQTIGTMIHKLIIHDQLASGYVGSSWVDKLPVIVKVINKKVVESLKDKKEDDYPKSENFTTTLLNEGVKVRVKLDNPTSLTGDKLIGKFRSSDIRFDPTVRTIVHVIIKPNQPPMYLLNGNVGPLHIEPIGYTINQLQIVHANETAPVKPITEVENNRSEVKSIIDKKVVKNVVYYLIWWKYHPKKSATWEKRSELMEDIPQLIKRYDKKSEQ
jgi:hypothetical protein